MKFKYRFHERNPNFYRPIIELTKQTQQNLVLLNSVLGIKFNNRAWIWKVQLRAHGNREVKGKFLHDIRILGKWGKHKIEYWRHETGVKGAGQTHIYIDTKKWRKFSITDYQRWPKIIRLDSAVKNKDKEMLLYLSIHENNFVRETVQLIIKMMELEYAN